MDRFSQTELRSLIEQAQGECVSIYLPTHRVKEEAQQDPIRLKNLLRDAERNLAGRDYDAAAAREILQPAFDLLEDRSFWQHQGQGLALFLGKGFMRHFRLPIRVEERVVLAEQFCLHPLFSLLNGDGEFYLLALSLNELRLFRGSRFGLEPMVLKGAPGSLADVTARYELQQQIQVHSGGRGDLHFGHGDPTEIRKDFLMKYFREVDSAIRETLGQERTPLMLAGVESNMPLYHEANTYMNLLQEGVPGNPDELQPDELHRQAWEIIAPRFRQRQREAAAAYERLAGTGRTAGAIASILLAAYHGRVESLFIPVGRSIWGRFDPETGTVTLSDEPGPGIADLTSLAAIHTYTQKGAVYAVEPDEMPRNEEVAAVFRY